MVLYKYRETRRIKGDRQPISKPLSAETHCVLCHMWIVQDSSRSGTASLVMKRFFQTCRAPQRFICLCTWLSWVLSLSTPVGINSMYNRQLPALESNFHQDGASLVFQFLSFSSCHGA